MSRKTKVICTLGPASRRKATIIKMANSGMDIARINFSHGNHADHHELIETVREVNREFRHDVKILQDLEGYRIRIGDLKRPLQLIKYQTIFMSNRMSDAADHIPLDADIDTRAFSSGMDIFVDDGKIQLKVVKVTAKQLQLEVITGGPLKSRKGVNVPRLTLQANILTDKDKEDIAFGIRHGVDYVAQSFVRNKQDILRVARITKKENPDCKIIAKIENRQGIRNVDSIIDASDGIMVARGDLGVSVPIYQIPMIQKDIIRRCRKKRKTVITATQMLESMTENTRPTRAEVSDVANAILDGSDYLMLSGETAAGCFPVKSVRMMCQIIDFTEKNG